MRFDMQIKPILAALRKHRLATVLIALEVALACAVLCNACFMIANRLQLMKVDSGVDERALAVLTLSGFDPAQPGDLNARVVAGLRAIPGMQSVSVVNTVPFGQANGNAGVMLDSAGKRFGGVVGLYFMPYLRLAGQPMAADLVAHLEHAIDVCGEDHVGLGTDGGITSHDDMTAYRRQLEDEIARRRALGIGAAGETADVATFLPDLCGPAQFQRLADLLATRGHSSARIEKILGGNFRRLMADAWAHH